MASSHFYPACGLKRDFYKAMVPVLFQSACHFSLLISQASHLQWKKLMLFSPSLFFFSFKCSGCVYMEGLVFLFSQLSKPGKLWLCSVVQFTSLCSDLPPRRIWGYGGWYRPGFSSDMQTCS